jgi:hypothetical protein
MSQPTSLYRFDPAYPVAPTTVSINQDRGITMSTAA